MAVNNNPAPPPPAGPNGRMERRISLAMRDSFGSDLSRVRVHGGQASEAARSLGAQAYATGNHVAFDERLASIHTAAHEAAHVVQQWAGTKSGAPSQQSAASMLAQELASGSKAPHEGRVVVTAPPVPATVAQSLGAAHATVKNLANVEQPSAPPPSAAPPPSGGSQ
jgi:hypothetical protein